jgi:hypothetical protein
MRKHKDQRAHKQDQTDVTWWLPRTTNIGAHLPATLPKAVARGGDPGSAELGVGPLTSSYHVATPGEL